MANLMVSDVCNLNCSYCFANQLEHSPEHFLSLADFETRLDFLQRSGIEQVRLIGGEPTLHPQFPELVRRIRQRGLLVIVFSHGLMPPAALNSLADLPLQACTVLVNMNASRQPEGPSSEEQARRLETLQRLGRRALPGFNLYSLALELDWLLPVIVQSGCQPAIRLGLAHATLQGGNRYLHPRQYPQAGRKIMTFARRAAARGVRLEFDCGFVRCMFSDQDLRDLQAAQTDIGWRCNPVLDIDLQGQALHCFPLGARAHLPLEAGTLASQLRDGLAGQLSAYRQAGIYRECSSCLFKQAGSCSGGCLAATLRRFRPGQGQVDVPDEWQPAFAPQTLTESPA